MPRLLVQFARFGPYHRARLSSAAAALGPLGWEVIGLQTAESDATYAWNETGGGDSGPRVVTAFPGRVHEGITAAECKRRLHPLLSEIKPDAMAIAGWSAADALSCLSWCRKNGARRIVMSETREADGRRVWWKERIKRHRISRFDAALVGGSSHRDYLVKLGLPAARTRVGYNVVDNAYFAAEAKRWREVETQAGPPASTRYFLASNRFVERKNLARLIEAYGKYSKSETGASEEGRRSESAPFFLWPLVLLGGGELKGSLIARCRGLGLSVVESAPWEPAAADGRPGSATVYLPGFRQIDELPRFYAHAGCFVHPAREEPWGLVINEAMACGLPILSCDNVGAAEELVDAGVNGFTFAAEDLVAMADGLRKIAGLGESQRLAMGAASARILEERCPTAAFGRGLAELLK